MKKQYNSMIPQGINVKEELEKRDLWKERRFRKGKTAKDHAGGAHKRNAENKSLRDAYVQNRNSNAVFPAATSRGNGNSSKRRKYYG